MSLEVNFRCSSPQGVSLSEDAVEVDDLPELRGYAARFVEGLVATPTMVDWRSWVLHVSDDLDEELFTMPFSSVLGRPH